MDVLDAFEFARRAEHLSGELSSEDLANFRSFLADAPVTVRYELTGVPKVMNLPGLHAKIHVEAAVPCPHCLEPVPYEDDIEITFAFVKSEAEADRLPIDEDEPGVDVVVGSKKLSIAALLEEELILSIPNIAHEDCDDEADYEYKTPETEAEKRPNPFAALASLKKAS